MAKQRLMVWKDQRELDAKDPRKKPVDMDEFNRSTLKILQDDPAFVRVLGKALGSKIDVSSQEAFDRSVHAVRKGQR